MVRSAQDGDDSAQEETGNVEEVVHTHPADSAMSAGFALDGALAEAASASLMISEARTADQIGFAQEGEEGGGFSLTNPLVLVGIGGLTGLAIWGLTGGGGNKAPTVDGAERSVSVAEDDQINVSINAIDPDGDDLTYLVTSSPGHGQTNVVNDTVVYKPDLDYNGPDSFVVSVSDTNGNSVKQTINVTVTPVNDRPVFVVPLDTATIRNDQTYTTDLTLTASDVDGDALTYRTLLEPKEGTLEVTSAGALTYTPAPGFICTEEVIVGVFDPSNARAEKSITITVLGLPGPPSGDIFTEIVIDEDTPIAFPTSIFDPDGDQITLTISAQPSHGTVSVSNVSGLIHYQPAPDYNGTDAFSIVGTAQDGSFTEGFSIVIQPVNDPPVAAESQSTQTRTDTPVNIPLSATDVDGDRIQPTVLVGDRPANGTLTTVENDPSKYVYTPNDGFNGTDTFKVTYSDGNGGTATTTWTVTVAANSPPIMMTSITEFGIDEDDSAGVTVVVGVDDPEGDPFTLTASASNGTVTKNADGSFTYHPDPDYWGLDSIVFTATDNRGASTTYTLLGAVTSVNDDPVQEAGTTTSIIVNNTDTAKFNVVFSDVDGDDWTPSVAKEPGHGAVTINVDGTFTYDPVDTYVGPDTFDMQVDDGNGGVVSYSVSVTVTGAEEVSLNGIDPSEPNGNFNAGVGSFILLISALQVAHMIVTAFGIDDVVRITDGTPEDFALIAGGNSNDLFLESVGAPLLQKIFFAGIFAESGPPAEYTFASVAETLGFNPFEFVTTVP
ncbi:MAG: tandem-95 repeat protein [Novosphingobium sp.]|nr:tandem-95 repeat protein [Novosphingobium sp.]